ncbi:prolyl oligopeptidase family serine peptidase [Glacieibacterium frigidum]|uniref:S9 family peptidase n=1 Tax=Glacieibacterium frigidum TaxID=2593303 RepID=A0A552U976_9SPHN|nr:prolyl oligopeptidase family serine peptidase [Glacieibacterium frigidum]TRW14765.1 S9 family peptidase [Glacieibacterium frigidum]
MIQLRAALLLPLLAAAPLAPDRHAWLEEIEGPRAIAQVKEWNADAAKILTASPGFAATRDRARALLEDDQRIATPNTVNGETVLNLWQDGKNPRGLWRAASLDSFASGKPAWRVLIDVDALGKAEGKSWVWKGADCRAPRYDRCLVSLADGGTDAVVVREFDIAAAKFVEGGFALPNAKTNVDWAGDDALYVATDYGAGSLTTSGYARIVKRWQRGTPLASATVVGEGIEKDVRVGTRVFNDGGTAYPVFERGVDFFNSEVSHIAGDRLIRSPLPTDAEIEDVLDGRMIARLQSPWQGRAAGTLVAYAIADVVAGKAPVIETVLVPTARQSIEQVAAGKGVVWVKLLDDVSGKLVALTRTASGWQAAPQPLAANSTVQLNAVAGVRDLAFVTVEGMLTPPTLYAVVPGVPARAVQSLPARFDASAMTVEQRFAKSKDGTRVPYFIVRKKGVRGPVPALVHAYGGFRAAQTPTYLVEQPYRAGPVALFQVERGNAFVLANIRGGGEYGPAWHQAALREKRQNAFDDLHAVAEDLIRTKVSAAKRIAISGRSNGGLLVGVAMEQRPDLYGAVIMGSPLIDMQRYSKLSAGASWMGEYGNPDVPADWAFIGKYSPYQNVQAGKNYPAPFIYTSTKDDRVHPGHARKFAAALGETGTRFYYDEAIEGGHAAGADRLADAQRAALIDAYLTRELSSSSASTSAPQAARVRSSR